MSPFQTLHGVDLKSKVVSGYDLNPINHEGQLALFGLITILTSTFKDVYDLELLGSMERPKKYIQTLTISVMRAIQP